MTHASTTVSGQVPQPIARTLRRLIRRVRAVILVRGVAAVVATAVGTLLLVMATDAAFVLFSQSVRWALTLAAVGLTVAVAVWALVLPLARTITLTGIARAIETRHPELHERLSSAVELLTSRDIPEVRGSAVLIAALAEEASHDALRVRPRAEIPLRSARPFLLAAVGVAVVLGGLWALYPAITSRLLKRAVAPFMNLPNVSADMLTVRPGDTILAEGHRLEVHVEVASPAVKRCSLRREMPDGAEQAEYMTALPDGPDGEPRFTMTLPPAVTTFRYRVHAGDAVSRFYDAKVVPPPLVKRLDAQYTFPAYTRREPATHENFPGDIKAVAGTQVTVTATLNKPIVQADLRVDGKTLEKTPVTIAAGPDGAATCTFQMTLTPQVRGRWSLAMRDRYGFENASPEHVLQAVPDSPPTVRILDPIDTHLRLKPTDRLPVTYAMTDDYGLGEAEFVVATDSRKRTSVAIPLPAQDGAGGEAGRAAAGQAPLVLSDLPLQGVRQFTFRLRAADNRPKALRGPGQEFSRTITVEVDRAATSYAVQRIEAEKEAIRKGLEKVIQDLQKAKRDSSPLAKQAGKPYIKPDTVAEHTDRMRQNLGEAEDATTEMTAQAAEGPFPGLAPKLKDLGDEIAAADQQTGEVNRATNVPERGQAAEQADKHIDQALAKAKDLAKELEKMAEAATLAQTLSDLAAEQAQLADQRAADAQPMDDWQKVQQNLADEVGDVVQDVPAAKRAELDQDRQAAADLAAQARRLQQDQAALARQSEQLAGVARADKALDDLAAQQAKLARDAAGEPVAADQAKPMDRAAENIKAGQLDRAVQDQRAAEKVLADRAQSQPQSGQPQSGEKPSGQPQSGEKPSGQQQSGEKPSGQQQSGEKPSGQQQSGEKPSGQQQSGEKPSGQPQSGEKPSGQQPAGQQQAGEQQSGEKPSGQPSGDQARQRAGELADRQTDIRKRTEDLAAQRKQLAQALAENQMSRLQAEQNQVARDATDLAERVAPVGKQPAETGERAAHDAQAAARQLPADVPEAARSAENAAGELAKLAGDLTDRATGRQPAGDAQAQGQQPSGEQASGQQAAGQQSSGEQVSGQQAAGQQSAGQPSSGQPSGGQPSGSQPSGAQPASAQVPQMAQQASGLAKRQAALADEMKALAQQAADQALAAAQENVASQTGDLQQAADALAQRATALAPQAAPSAAQASQAIGSARQSQGQAQQSLEGGSPQAAAPAQQSASDALGQAADALGQLGQGLAQAAEGMPTPSSEQAAVGQPLAEGHASATQAAATQSAAAAAQAAQSLAQAAGQAAAQAAAMGAQPGQNPTMQPGMASGYQANSKFGTGAREISITAAKLEALGIKLSDWARLPGELRNEILQAANEGEPEEYRALIKRYFQRIAARGGGGEEAP
ncbi:MAG: DUF4175 family protein [Planctomycetes bacterium]|nr:DUF4175 family protein [Planctomycetota bacterium]